ncbi:EF-P lysine aminoacylase EpmA [Histidinibacterium aquaticum]|uniref:EF-P lysine aminoacylase GenX n=1 Tax=Histidinibacterium aquaticum TaxID=2613962 RepID=A0A5J5GGM6_9RHOB|nr:EF-P lysine aminoacylase EpmA [Histidinibacterium aquaticum]KAA9006674.1 EF-P lysine aminoacylase GenX [Histidinibacterium aquaticum]
MSWWRSHADRRPLLLARNRIQSALRAWFAQEGFTEVDPACLVTSPGNETHLHAFETEVIGTDLARRSRYLHTSPEFAMKKLLAGGEEKIFAFAHVWRNREGGSRHTAEFTMLEWYRAGAPYEQLMDDCTAILSIAARAAGVESFRHGDISCDPLASPRRVTLAESFAAQGMDLLSTLTPNGPDTAALAAELDRAGIRHAADDTWSDLFSRALTERIEPALGPGPVILDAYPSPEAALARRSVADPRTAERFELFACGVELANGFGELTDPAEQRARFEADMDRREEIYGSRYPLDEDLLDALAEMPPTSGIALGFDRLVMLATHAPRLTDVMWTPPADR